MTHLAVDRGFCEESVCYSGGLRPQRQRDNDLIVWNGSLKKKRNSSLQVDRLAWKSVWVRYLVWLFSAIDKPSDLVCVCVCPWKSVVNLTTVCVHSWVCVWMCLLLVSRCCMPWCTDVLLCFSAGCVSTVIVCCVTRHTDLIKLLSHAGILPALFLKLMCDRVAVCIALQLTVVISCGSWWIFGRDSLGTLQLSVCVHACVCFRLYVTVSWLGRRVWV